MGFEAAAPPAGGYTGGYPVGLSVTEERTINRLWGIPFVGVFVRAILAIPHFVVLGLLAIGIYIWGFLGWIPILVTGRVPGIAVALLREYLQRSYKVLGYVMFLMPGGYPGLEPGPGMPMAVNVDLQDLTINRFWGIPVIGLLVRLIVAIPHMIVLAVLAIVMYVILLVVWIPILLFGSYPGWAASFLGGFSRYAVRVTAYLLLLPVPYPPFSLS
jgi:hypothetical protein